MKAVRIIFSIGAAIMAVGAAFAFRPSLPDTFQGYVQLTNPSRCEQSIMCDNGGAQLCETDSKPVYQIKNGTQCAIQLTRSNPNGQ